MSNAIAHSAGTDDGDKAPGISHTVEIFLFP